MTPSGPFRVLLSRRCSCLAVQLDVVDQANVAVAKRHEEHCRLVDFSWKAQLVALPSHLSVLSLELCN